jgi:GNAT superfamily N-acetyltransferase
MIWKMDIDIRSAEESDFSQILELFKEFAAFEKQPDAVTNSVDRMIKEKDHLSCFVAETNDKRIVGYATYFFTYYTWIGKCLYMDDLYVKPEYRGEGIGKRLMNRVIEFAKCSQCHKLRWQVSNWNNPAVEFYKSIGATIDDIERNCDLMLD